MTPLTLIVIAFLIALPVMAFSFAGGAVVVALPVSAIGLATVGLLDFKRRRKQAVGVSRFRAQAKADKVDFTERDRETIVSD